MRVGLLCIAFILTASARADDLQDKFKEASAALEKGDFGTANKLADEAVKAHPKNAMAYALRATLRDRLGRVADALAGLDEALQLDPKRPEPINHPRAPQFKLLRIQERVGRLHRII